MTGLFGVRGGFMMIGDLLNVSGPIAVGTDIPSGSGAASNERANVENRLGAVITSDITHLLQ